MPINTYYLFVCIFEIYMYLFALYFFFQCDVIATQAVSLPLGHQGRASTVVGPPPQPSTPSCCSFRAHPGSRPPPASPLAGRCPSRAHPGLLGFEGSTPFLSQDRPPVPPCVCAQSLRRVRLYHPRDCSPPGSSVPGILQARTLEWVVIPSSGGSSRPGDQTHVSRVSCAGPISRGQCFQKADKQHTVRPHSDRQSGLEREEAGSNVSEWSRGLGAGGRGVLKSSSTSSSDTQKAKVSEIPHLRSNWF